MSLQRQQVGILSWPYSQDNLLTCNRGCKSSSPNYKVRQKIFHVANLTMGCALYITCLDWPEVIVSRGLALGHTGHTLRDGQLV